MKTKLVFRREVRPEDVEIVRDMIISTGFFYDFEIPVALELVEDRIELGDQSDYHFVFAELEGKTVSYTCFGSIAGTEGSFDLYWIVTHNDYRGQGIGNLIIEETHRIIREMGGRIVVAETSSLEKYTPTRHFYNRIGYTQEAQINDFYKEGDGKVFFVKRL
ncbi:MAG: GNAT family N-acetyltransferase [Bacteroidota bacterium]